MREIKFRAWDEEIKCMVKVDSMHFPLGKPNKKDIAVFNEEEFYYEWVHDYKLMQYTGIKDKNGKEIYEGDIVCYKYNGELIKVMVEFVNGAYFAGDAFLYNKRNVAKIIGNIYENPELLEK